MGSADRLRGALSPLDSSLPFLSCSCWWLAFAAEVGRLRRVGADA
jgi:hypothetical protein